VVSFTFCGRKRKVRKSDDIAVRISSAIQQSFIIHDSLQECKPLAVLSHTQAHTGTHRHTHTHTHTNLAGEARDLRASALRSPQCKGHDLESHLSSFGRVLLAPHLPQVKQICSCNCKSTCNRQFVQGVQARLNKVRERSENPFPSNAA
jgi:hypothetical protein